METRTQIVCLCGSTRFAEQFRAVNRDLTLAGAIVVAPAEFEHAGDQTTDEQKAALGALHSAKIDLADRVMVVNPGGYIGDVHATWDPLRTPDWKAGGAIIKRRWPIQDRT